MDFKLEPSKETPNDQQQQQEDEEGQQQLGQLHEQELVQEHMREIEEKDKDVQSTSWDLSKYFKFQITLENTGSVARDHMANERTLLSWIRTALTFLTFGAGFLQFYRIEIKIVPSYMSTDSSSSSSSLLEHKLVERLTRPIGLLCIILSIITISFGSFRYFQVQNSLIANNYPATRLTIVILILINLSMLILLMVLDIKISIL